MSKLNDQINQFLKEVHEVIDKLVPDKGVVNRGSIRILIINAKEHAKISGEFWEKQSNLALVKAAIYTALLFQIKEVDLRREPKTQRSTAQMTRIIKRGLAQKSDAIRLLALIAKRENFDLLKYLGVLKGELDIKGDVDGPESRVLPQRFLVQNLIWVDDPGHGWLKVPIGNVAYMGIENSISGYSFIDGGFAYLEEDVDATTYLNALEKFGLERPELKTTFVSRFSRNKDRFGNSGYGQEFWDGIRQRLDA